MANKTGISWTDSTHNPWIGCVEVSEGCANCYARELDARYKYGGETHWGKVAGRRPASAASIQAVFALNAKGLREGRRYRVFCASMADVFEDHPALPTLRARLWDVLRETPALDWQLLTKRPENVVRFMPTDLLRDAPNVWLGFSAENSRRYEERIPYARAWRAAGFRGVAFVSAEPLIGPIALGNVEGVLDWVIVGGESGAKRRPFNTDWAVGLQHQCQKYGIAFFGKQTGHLRASQPLVLNGQTWHAFPERVPIHPTEKPRPGIAEPTTVPPSAEGHQ